MAAAISWICELGLKKCSGSQSPDSPLHVIPKDAPARALRPGQIKEEMVKIQLHVPVTEAGPSGSGNQYGPRYRRGGIEDVVEVELHLHEIERETEVGTSGSGGK